VRGHSGFKQIGMLQQWIDRLNQVAVLNNDSPNARGEISYIHRNRS
jgi:hypothetical protein